MFNKIAIGSVALMALVSAVLASNIQEKFGQAGNIETVSVKQQATKFSVVECSEGAKVLSAAGFSHVFATECSGAEFSYNGFRSGNEYSIIFNARSNGFVAVAR